MKRCRHDNTGSSTLKLINQGSTPDFPYSSWLCVCGVCGNHTPRCLTAREAQLRGQLEWWDETVCCERCGHSRVETHSGERALVCWREGFGKKVAAGRTCPSAVRRTNG